MAVSLATASKSSYTVLRRCASRWLPRDGDEIESSECLSVGVSTDALVEFYLGLLCPLQSSRGTSKAMAAFAARRPCYQERIILSLISNLL